MGPRAHCALTLLVGGLAVFSLPLLPTAMIARAEALPPELPRVFLDTALVAPTGRTIAVPAGGNLQAALDAAQPGDVITLQAGATYQGPFTLPNKAGAGWITVRTSAPDSSLPAPGTRATPAYAAVMPKVVVGDNVGGAIRTAAGAHHFRFIGLEIKPLAGALVYSLIELGTGSETSEAPLPHDIVIDRCYVHGNPGEASGRGVALNGKSLAVIDSSLADFKDQDFDTQAIMGWNGPGPFKIVNNYLEAAGENVMFGGGDPAIANLVPSDIEIRGNHFFKPTSWRGVWAAVKNLFELKNARRVLIEGNIFENIWLAAQGGFAMQLTVRNQDGTAPWSTIEDVTIRKNIVRHASAGVNILAADDPNPSQTMKRVLLQDNLFDDITGSTWGGPGRLFQILGWAAGSTDLVIEHNTGVQTENLNYSDGLAHLGFIYRNNLTPRGGDGYGFIGAGAAEGLPTLTVYFPLAVFLRNVIAGGNALLYPPANFFPASLAAVGFVDLAGRNYRLAASSPYKNGATDGTDIGADIDALETATAGVLSGTPATSDTSRPTISLSAPSAGALVSGATVTVSATAADNVGVVRVQFKLDGGDLGAAVTTPPYSVTWNTKTATNAAHSLTALAFDAAGNLGSSAPVTVTVSNDTTPPTVAISSPTAGQTVSGTVTIATAAADNVGVTRIDYLQDGQLLAALAPPAFTFAWSTTSASNGPHSLATRAYDAAGNVTTSTAVSVTVSNSNPAPTLGALAPSSAAAAGAAFTLTVNGSSLSGSSVVRWNGADRTTTFVSGTQLTAAIPASDLVTSATAQVTVFTRAPGGGTSTALPFTITAATNPIPASTSLSPSDATAGGTGFTLTVTGANFVPSSGVRWNGADRTSTYVSSTQLQATIQASDIATAGTAQVTVVTPAPGGGTSALPFTVNNSAPAPPPPGSGLVAAYSFNQGSGGTVPDASGNGNHGTIAGATWTSQGRYGSALSFDGVSSRVTASNVALGAAFTIMAWVQNPTNAAYETVVTVGTDRDLYLRNGVITFWDGSVERLFGSAISKKGWHHVAIVSDGSSVRVYLDGAPSGTPQVVSLGAVIGTLQAGAWTMGAVNHDFFGGRIDEVRIYSRALAQTEVQTDMNTPIAP